LLSNRELANRDTQNGQLFPIQLGPKTR